MLIAALRLSIGIKYAVAGAESVARRSRWSAAPSSTHTKRGRTMCVHVLLRHELLHQMPTYYTTNYTTYYTKHGRPDDFHRGFKRCWHACSVCKTRVMRRGACAYLSASLMKDQDVVVCHHAACQMSQRCVASCIPITARPRDVRRRLRLAFARDVGDGVGDSFSWPLSQFYRLRTECVRKCLRSVVCLSQFYARKKSLPHVLKALK